MALKVAVQMDPIERINIRGDSTFALMLEAQKRGHSIDYYTPDRLAQLIPHLVTPTVRLTISRLASGYFRLSLPTSAQDTQAT